MLTCCKEQGPDLRRGCCRRWVAPGSQRRRGCVQGRSLPDWNVSSGNTRRRCRTGRGARGREAGHGSSPRCPPVAGAPSSRWVAVPSSLTLLGWAGGGEGRRKGLRKSVALLQKGRQDPPPLLQPLTLCGAPASCTATPRPQPGPLRGGFLLQLAPFCTPSYWVAGSGWAAFSRPPKRARSRHWGLGHTCVVWGRAGPLRGRESRRLAARRLTFQQRRPILGDWESRAGALKYELCLVVLIPFVVKKSPCRPQ